MSNVERSEYEYIEVTAGPGQRPINCVMEHAKEGYRVVAGYGVEGIIMERHVPDIEDGVIKDGIKHINMGKGPIDLVPDIDPERKEKATELLQEMVDDIKKPEEKVVKEKFEDQLDGALETLVEEDKIEVTEETAAEKKRRLFLERMAKAREAKQKNKANAKK